MQPTAAFRHFLCIALVASFGCGDDIAVERRTLGDHVRQDPRFSQLEAGLTDAGLIRTLDQPGPYTVFAPTNGAFDKLFAEREVPSTTALSELMRYHLLDGQVEGATLRAQTALRTLLGTEMHVRYGSGGVLLDDGVLVTVDEIQADNGVLHIIDAVLVRPLIATTEARTVEVGMPLDEFEFDEMGIPTTGVTTSFLEISPDDVGAQRVHSLEVRLDIDHARIGDVFVRVQHLEADVGAWLLRGPRTELDDIKVTFADSADRDAQTDFGSPFTPDAPAYTGTHYRAFDPLEHFVGVELAGTWLVTVYDVSPGDTGTFNSWTLVPTVSEVPPAEAIVIHPRTTLPAAVARGFAEEMSVDFRRVGGLAGDVNVSASIGDLVSDDALASALSESGTVRLDIPRDQTTGAQDLEVLVATTSDRVSRILVRDTSVVDPERDGISLAAHVPLSDLGARGLRGSDIWGWTDPVSGDEIALVATSAGTAFVDVTTPGSPIVLGTLATETETSDWRDIKVYADHAFIVSEAVDHGLQVFDLTQLRGVAGPQTFTATSLTLDFGNAHNIAIDEAAARAYVVGSNFPDCFGGVLTYDISTPTAPALLSCFSGGLPGGAGNPLEFPSDVYVHDAQCLTYSGPDTEHAGKQICITSDGSDNGVGVVDLTDAVNPVQLSRTRYQGAGYTHQGWLTDDQRYFIMNDEFDEFIEGSNTRSYVFDMVDLDAPVLVGSIINPRDAIGHNTYVKDNVAYQANYTSGLRLVDVSDIASGIPSEMAFYDTYPNDDADDDGVMESLRSCVQGGFGNSLVPHPGGATKGDSCGVQAFRGAWSVYPFFDSGVIVLSDIDRGLFVLQRD